MRGRMSVRIGCLTGLAAAAILSRGPAAAQVASDPLATFNASAQIIVPQTHGFALNRSANAVQIQSVEARVKIIERTASTTLQINLHNPSSTQAEATVLLPVPDGAVVSSFDFDGAASEPTARLMPRDEARRVYNAIVAKVRDPALLEFAGYNLIRSSVFPVPANGEQKVRLTYEHILEGAENRVDYLLPRSESLERRVPWRISVEVQAKDSIATVYSPSHDLVTTRRAPRHLTVTLAASAATAPGPFRLSYLLERADVTASMFAYPDPKIGGGYFLLMAGVPAEQPRDAAAITREVTIVLDRSGSMAGAKMDQARAAAVQVIEGLANGEFFNIIDYATAVSAFASKPVSKDHESARAARKYIESILPTGGTNIHDALVEALRPEPSPGTLPILLFLTDGLPTVGQTSEVTIRQLVEKGNPHHRRVFTFGVGNDVNVPLLDRIADLTRATTTYVLPDEDVELKVAQVFKRLFGPVLAGIQLETLDTTGQPSTRLIREQIPSNIPDLYEDDQLIVLGQYQEESPIQFRLSGNFRGQARTFTFDFDMSKATTRNGFVPRLWASRRIAFLVDEIRQAGAAAGGMPPVAGESLLALPHYRELSDEILRLSTEFGILTEYTAFLATEGTNLSDWNTLRDACSVNLDSRAVKTRYGQTAVNQGINFNDQKGQSKLNYDNRFVNEKLQTVEISTVQQVCDRAFFKRGEQWIDGRAINMQQTEVQPDEIIEFGSEAHFRLVDRLVEEGRQAMLSLPGDIVIRCDDRNILVKYSP